MTALARPRLPLRPSPERRGRARPARLGARPWPLAATGLVIAGLALLPLVYLVIRALGVEARRARLRAAAADASGSWRDDRPGPARRCRDGRHRRAHRLADHAHGPARPAAVGRPDGHPAGPAVVRRGLRVPGLLRAARHAPGAARPARRRAPAVDRRAVRGGAGADPRVLPVRGPGDPGRHPAPGPGGRGVGAAARRPAADRLPAGDPAGPGAGHRRRRAARRALRPVRLRGRRRCSSSTAWPGPSTCSTAPRSTARWRRCWPWGWWS